MPSPAPSILTIGNFDGVHLGHAALVRRARALADGDPSSPRVVALAFDPTPLSVLAPQKAPPVVSTFDQRRELLLAHGADEVVRLEPTPELLGATPEQFVDQLVERFAPVAIVEGPDFAFGRGRAGDVSTLAELGSLRGFTVDVVPPVTVALDDQTVVVASSTVVRWLIEHGRSRDAARVLGRPYTLTGTVARGDQRGRTLGFPTANLDTPLLLPADGVYAGLAALPDGRHFPAAVHVGPRDTFGLPARTLEPHLIGWDGPVAEGTDEYGWTLRVALLDWLRGQVRFSSADELVDQMTRDCARAEETVRRAVDDAADSTAQGAAR